LDDIPLDSRYYEWDYAFDPDDFDVVEWVKQNIRYSIPEYFRSEPMSDTNPVLPTVDLTTLTIDQLNDYRHELTLSIREPGTDFDPDDEAQQKVYIDQIEAIKAQLAVLGYTG
jgi:hypothetical protein